MIFAISTVIAVIVVSSIAMISLSFKGVILWHISPMPRASARSRLDRLDLLASRLKADEPMTIAEIASELGISARTLARDLEILRERGLPVESDRGRGGGVRLHRTWGIGRVTLTYREAVDLLVSLAIAEQLQSPWLIANLSSIRRKLTASFAPALRDRIEALRNRILIGHSASASVVQGFAVPDGDSINALFRAFLETRVLRFSYTDVQNRKAMRLVEPQLLLLNYPVWYVIGWDRDRDAVRSFRCDRMRFALVEEEQFQLRRPEIFDKAIEGVDVIKP
ncbi:MAG: WYL domain-containing protein [Mesorhizobium sp.]|nr:MAG: WYL domain-containing protein [Mesorhizobium sp.]RWA78453.1 MAG: WYL domain-containing protein [Mesorhizobium sp.]